MAGNVQVQLQFTANTEQAKQQIIGLQNQLKQLSSIPAITQDSQALSKPILEAKKAASQLGIALENALDVNTGKLSLTKFAAELSRTGKTLPQYAQQLSAMGAQGRAAFQSLAQSIAASNSQFTVSSKLISSMWTNLKNVAKWQVSSAVLTSFTGVFSDAFRYAQDLNESLTNIRIVSGQSTDQMARFAEQANRAAKALSTTTTEYTDAALIYYQQGLNDQQVKERADITIKMANASGQSAQIVSDQMTAVWNNFYDGSKSLESYSDAMVALGAATASSSEEIATGLEKFAAIAETTGLSFEYASAALATVTATTRQSADVVGTAFKTLFARIQDLEVGETLEDGTTLGKYSEALNAVGVNIKDANGGLKDMDIILNELAGVWDKLHADEKAALAQTVAGTRQYTQLIALMDNWDFMEQNLATVEGSAGALQEQADIYAESWDGASKRVKAAAEGIYDSLINEDFIIDLTDGFGQFLELIEKIIDSMGGFQGVLSAVYLIFSKIFSSQMQASVANMAQSLYSMTKAGKAEAAGMRDQAATLAANMIRTDGTPVGEMQKQVYLDQLNFDKQIAEQRKNMTQEQLQQVNNHKEIIALAGQNLGLMREEEQIAKDTVTDLQAQVNALKKKQQANLDKKINSSDAIGLYDEELKKANLLHSDARVRGREGEDTYAKRLVEAYGLEEQAARDLYNAYKMLSPEEKQLINQREKGIQITKRVADKEKELADAKNKHKQATKEAADGQKNYNQIIQEGMNALKPTKFETFASGLIRTFNVISQVTMGLSSMRSVFDTLSNPDMGGWDKFLSITMSLSMATPMLISGLSQLFTMLKTLHPIQAAINLLEEKYILLTHDKIRALTAEQLAEKSGLAVEQAQLLISQDRIESYLKRKIASGEEVSAIFKETAAKKLNITADQMDIIMSEMKAGASFKEAAAQAGVTLQTNLNTKAIWANVAATWAKVWPVLAVVAALGLLVGAVALSINAYNADAAAAKEAAAAAETAAKSFEEAQTAYENFKSSMDKYDSAVDGLKNLTKGTIEYKEQIMKANEEALKLIKSQNLMYGKDYDYGEDGIIQFKPGVLEEAKEKEYQQMESAQAYKEFTSSRARSAQTKADLTEFNRKELGSGVDWAAAGGKMAGFTAGGAALGATLGTVVPVIGNAIGAAGGAIIGAIAGLGAGIYTAVETWGTSTDNEEKAMLKLAEEYARIGDAVLTEDGIRSALKDIVPTDVIDRIVSANTDALKQQLQAIASDTAAIKGEVIAGASAANRENTAYQALGGNDENKKAEQQGLADKIIGNRVANMSTEEKDAIRKEQEKLFDWDDQDAYDEYLKARFGEEAGNYRVTNQKGTNATLQKKNEDGTWENVGEKNSLSNDEVIDYLTQHKASQFDEVEDQKVLDSVNSVGDALDKISGVDQEAISAVKGQLAAGEAVDLSVLSPEQVNNLKTELQNAGAEISQAHAKAISDAAMEYTPEKYQQQLERQSESIIASGAKELEMTEEALEAYTEDLMENNEALKDNKKIAAQTAVESAKFSKNLDKLEKVLNDNIDTLKTAEKGSLDYYEALGNIQQSLEDTFGVDVDASFIEENLNLIEEAATGDIDAVNRLRAALSQEIICEVMAVDNFEEVNSDIQDLSNKILEMDPSIDVGATLDTGDFLTAANDLVSKAGMSVDEAQSYFNSLGYEPTFETTTKEVLTKVPQERTHTDYEVTPGTINIGGVDFPYPTIDKITTTSIAGYTDVMQTMEVPAVSGDGTPKIKELRKTGSTLPTKSSGSSGSGGKGGGGGGSKKASKADFKKSDDAKKFHERYAEINNLLEKNNHLREQNNRLADHAIGATRIKSLEKENKLIDQNIKLLERQLDENRYYMEYDLQKMKDSIPNFDFQIDSQTGYILNLETLQKQWDADMEAARQEYNNQVAQWIGMTADQQEATKNADDKTLLDRANETWENKQEDYEKKQKIVNSYLEEVAKRLELEAEREEQLIEKRSNNLDIIIEKYEKYYNAMEMLAKPIEHALNMLNEDDLNDMINSIGLLDQQLSVQRNSYEELNNELWEFNHQMSLGNLNADEYLEKLINITDRAYETAEALKEIRDEMYGKYSEAFDLGMEKIEDLNEHFDDLSGSLEHYQSILELLGKGRDFKQLDKIYKGQAQVAENAFMSAEAIYKMAKQQFDEADAKYQASIGTADEEFYKKQRDAAEQYITETYDTWLSKGEEYAEKLRQVLENALEEAAKTLEYALTNDLGFDQLSKELDHLQAQEEIFLTDTNKSYETTKLIRQAQMDIDKMTNKAHQNILKQFQAETKALQDQKQLSKDELELQQLKYNVLVAQIALEDARDAKNKVRLMRDSQGNFNYVYTADQNQIDQARQTLDDANNEYYNKALEVTNNATQQQISLQQEAAEEIAAINADETLSQEQKEEKIADIRKKTMELLGYYDDLYTIGSTALAEKTGEAWTSNLRKNIATTEEFGIATQKYMSDSANAYEEFNTKVNKVEKLVGSNNREISNSIQNITTKSENLEEKITNPTTGVVAKVEKSLEDMVKSTEKWYNETGKYLDAEIEKFENLAIKAREAYLIASGVDTRDISAMMANITNPEELARLTQLRNIKIAANPDLKWTDKENQNYAQQIEDYLKQEGTSHWDSYVQERLAARAAKMEEMGTTGLYESNTELLNRILGTTQKAKQDIIAEKETDKWLEQSMQAQQSQETSSGSSSVGSYKSPTKTKETEKEVAIGTIEKQGTIHRKYVGKGLWVETPQKGDTKKVLPDGSPDRPEAYITMTFDGTKWVNNSSPDYYCGAAETIPLYHYTTNMSGEKVMWKSADWNIGYNRRIISDPFKFNGETYVKLSGFDFDMTNYYFALRHLKKQKSFDSSHLGAAYGSLPGHYDTGGYTGAWGAEGKLAVLHEKELVLNAEDTENLLKTVDLVREVLRVTDPRRVLQSHTIDTLLSKAIVANGGQAIEQHVTITAEFPNAIDKEEIKAAFDDIINEAVQYAGMGRD